LEEFNVTRDFDVNGGGEVWYARQQLFFRCTLCPTGAMNDTHRHKEVSLVFFSTFEPISLTPDSCMQRRGVPPSHITWHHIYDNTYNIAHGRRSYIH
jgi:hypothetical protein